MCVCVRGERRKGVAGNLVGFPRISLSKEKLPYFVHTILARHATGCANPPEEPAPLLHVPRTRTFHEKYGLQYHIMRSITSATLPARM